MAGVCTLALLDNGSEGDLIDYSHVRRLQLPILKLNNPIPLYLGNGKLYKVLTEATLADLRIGDHKEQIVCYLTDVPRYQLVLGDTWLQEHNPTVDWKARSITFNAGMFRERLPANAIIADAYDYFMQGKKNYSMEESELEKKVPVKIS
jgi:hypothetical protein